MRAWWMMGVVALMGCRELATQLEAGAELTCELGEPTLPGTFPVAPEGRDLLPTADGFVREKDRWRFGADGQLVHTALRSEVRLTASSGSVTAVLTAEGIELWEGESVRPCARPTESVRGLNLSNTEVLWVEASRSGSLVHRAPLTPEGCGPAEFLYGSGEELSFPARLGSTLVAVNQRSRALIAFGSAGQTRLAQLPPSELLSACAGPNGALIAMASGLHFVSPEGQQRELQPFARGSATAACEGGLMTVSFRTPESTFIDVYDTAGRRLERQATEGIAVAGLAGGGWKREGFAVRGWDGRLLLTRSTAQVRDVSAVGDSAVVSFGFGPALRWENGAWTFNDLLNWNFEHELRDASGAFLTLRGSGGPFELEARGRILKKVRWLTFEERPTFLRPWSTNRCSDESLFELEYDHRGGWLFVQRGSQWFELTLPDENPLLAQLDGDQVVIRTRSGQQLRRSLAGDTWVEEPAGVALPAGATRLLPVGASFAAETPRGVFAVNEEGQRLIAAPGLRLVGVTGRYVLAATEAGLRAVP